MLTCLKDMHRAFQKSTLKRCYRLVSNIASKFKLYNYDFCAVAQTRRDLVQFQSRSAPQRDLMILAFNFAHRFVDDIQLGIHRMRLQNSCKSQPRLV